MKKYKLQKVVPYVLISSMLLTGCGKKVDCSLPTRHVHLYTKNTNNTTITTYIDSEYENINGYNWHDEYIEITKTDESLFKLLNSKGLFNALDNWDYLYNEMANNHDYLKFYYEYYTEEEYTETDSEGNETTYIETVHHDGWTSNPHDSDNTGETRLYHHKYYAYRVNYINGQFKLERSPLVDDIREVIADYPYVCENGYSEEYSTFYFHSFELPFLSPSDFNVYNHPDLTNTTPNLGPSLKK